MERSAASALVLFRLASWALTSVFYLTAKEPPGATGFKLGVVGALLVAAVLTTWLLDRARGDSHLIANLATTEALLIPTVLYPTGGLGSPFVWYALNPLMVAAVYLEGRYTWKVAFVFLTTAAAATALSPVSGGTLVSEHGEVALIMTLVTLVVRLQANLFRRLEQQAVQVRTQQQALEAAYHALEAKGEALGILAEFQQRAIAATELGQLFRLLTATVHERLGADWAGVLQATAEPAEDLRPCPWLPDFAGCRLFCAGEVQGANWEPVWREVEGAACGGALQVLTIGEGNLAAPVLLDERRVMAVFMAGGYASPLRPELEVLLEYARQLAGRIWAAQRIQGTLDYLGNVYQVVESAGVSHGEQDLVELITIYAKQLTGAEKAAYWAADPDDPEALRAYPAIIRGLRDGLLAEDFSTRVAQWWASAGQGFPANLDHYEQESKRWQICYTIARSSDRRYGVLFVMSSRAFSMDIDVTRTMAFLGYLTGAILERQRAEQLHGQLLVAQEQSRIAAEIHDGVSQSLFSLVYGLQGVMGTLENGQPEEARAMLGTLRDVAARVSREIRTSIYQLSQTEGKGTFVRAIKSYLNDFESLHDVRTALKVSGSEDNLSPALRRALYRIVREATSNAVRHGKATEVSVALTLTPQRTVAEVADNGSGFVPPSTEGLLQRASDGGRGSGFGLLNMAQLARSFDGSLAIESAPGKGARVIVRIPDPESQGRESEASETAVSR